MIQKIEVKVLGINDLMYKLLISYHAKTFYVSVRIIGNMIYSENCILIHHPLSYDIKGLSNNWWNNIVGLNKVLNTSQYLILTISVHDIIRNCNILNLYDIANIQNEILSFLKIDNIFCNIGGSFGGAMAIAFSTVTNKKINKSIIISTTCKLHGNQVLYRRLVADIISNSQDKHLMVRSIQKLNILFYRNPQNRNITNIDKYLLNCDHSLPVVDPDLYLMMLNKLNNFSCPSNLLAKIEGEIFLIYSSSDALYLPEQIFNLYDDLINLNKMAYIYELISDKGHDAFLIEQTKISKLLSNIL